MTEFDNAGLKAIRSRVAPYLHETPIWHSATLSRLTGLRVFLKAELFQKTGSYKPRGMLWSLMALSPEERRRGVITFSAGNAAQGLAYAGGILGSPVTVTMPETASPVKAEATRGYGAEVILHGTPAECLARCRELAAERELTFISSYDHIPLMQGHATLGLELLDAEPALDAVILGVGGGGMLGGMAMALDARGSRAELVGVEPEGAPAMHRSMEAGSAVDLESIRTIADGLAAPGTGRDCFDIARKRVSRIVLVSDDEILDAMKVLMSRCKLFAEPAGAAALAGLLSGRSGLPRNASVACVVSGGNLDLSRLRELLGSH